MFICVFMVSKEKKIEQTKLSLILTLPLILLTGKPKTTMSTKSISICIEEVLSPTAVLWTKKHNIQAIVDKPSSKSGWEYGELTSTEFETGTRYVMSCHVMSCT